MSAKRFSSRFGTSKAANSFRVFTALFLLFAFSFVPSTGACAEAASHYRYEDFASFLGFTEEKESSEPFLHTILIADCSERNIASHSLIEFFPNYDAIRELPPSEEVQSRAYTVYRLEDGSNLFFFMENDVLASVCRMIPRCTVDDFSAIQSGLSTPGDVVALDANTVFNPFIQWGPVSYHCLSDGTFRQLTYKQSADSTDEFVVDEITTISQGECLSVLRDLLCEDMP